MPPQEDSGIKPKEYQWPFAYSFTEIANFAAEYGYKYAAGIDGREKEYFDDLWIGAFESFDIKERIKPILDSFGDGEELYDKLDVKFMFRFTSHLDDKTFADYWITQESGVLKMYEVKNDYKPENITVITYSRDRAWTPYKLRM